MSEQPEQLEKANLLAQPIEKLGLSKRHKHILRREKINTIGQLREMSDWSLLDLRGLGQLSLEEIREKTTAYFAHATSSDVIDEDNVIDEDKVVHESSVVHEDMIDFPDGKDLVWWVDRWFGGLKENEQEILRDRYGLKGEDPLTLKVIAQKVGLTRERVRQHQEKALEKLAKSTYWAHFGLRLSDSITELLTKRNGIITQTELLTDWAEEKGFEVGAIDGWALIRLLADVDKSDKRLFSSIF